MKRKRTEATAEYGSGCLHERLGSCQKVCVCVFFVISSSVLVSDSLIKYILIVCCFIVAMPLGKRETEKKGNTPVNTGPSPNSDVRAINLVEEADEPARGSGPSRRNKLLRWDFKVHIRSQTFIDPLESRIDPKGSILTTLATPCILIVCCFIVAMPSGKREAEKKGNTPVNTGPSPNSDGRANNLVEEADEPARGSGPLQYNLVVTVNN
ncbi:hypothetical protein T09_13760 [Trichinella sp. T9]|nr:hypothetical protein T09_13760 [Trichinella sp. T9]